ncbi:hypothetical protein ACQR50_09605 [Sphingomonas sp. Xoc002]|uniref:hypothetical protein n=1 Tax=Sphingomonas sp. Xoc002 TaxID=2837624 RepID=UPI003D183EBD
MAFVVVAAACNATAFQNESEGMQKTAVSCRLFHTSHPVFHVNTRKTPDIDVHYGAQRTVVRTPCTRKRYDSPRLVRHDRDGGSIRWFVAGWALSNSFMHYPVASVASSLSPHGQFRSVAG